MKEITIKQNNILKITQYKIDIITIIIQHITCVWNYNSKLTVRGDIFYARFARFAGASRLRFAPALADW